MLPHEAARGGESPRPVPVHQFTKVGDVRVHAPGDSEAMHAELLRIEERMFSALKVRSA